MSQHFRKHPNVERAQARRQQVLDAAEDCFLQHGFHNASMAEISRAAGMSAGHIYNYFENKEAIIAAIVLQHIEAGLTPLDTLPDSREGVIQALQQIARERITTFSDKKQAALMFDILSEAARSSGMATVVYEFDIHARERLASLCAAYSETITAEELAFRVDVLKMLFKGVALKVTGEPDFDQEKTYQMVCRVIGLLFAPGDGNLP